VLEELPLNFTQTNAQRLQRTLELCALVKKDKEEVESHFIIRDQLSIESSLNSWPKVVISQEEMELVVNQFMVKSSMMKTSS